MFALGVRRMRCTVYLHNNARLDAREIRNIRTYWMLPAELAASELPAP
jgi:hypothetical protein